VVVGGGVMGPKAMRKGYKKKSVVSKRKSSKAKKRSSFKKGGKGKSTNRSAKIIRSPVNGESYSKASVSYSKRKYDKSHDFSQPTVVKCDRVWSSGCESNEQISENSFFGFAGTDISGSALAAFSNANGFVPQLWAMSQRDKANTILDALSAQQFPPNIVGDFDKGRKLLLNSCKNELVLTSATNVDCEIMIYDLIAKTTAGNDIGPSASWIPSDIWQKAIVAGGDSSGYAGSTNPSSISTSRYGENPQANKYFNLKWKTVGKHRVHLAAGRSHVHSFSFSPNIMVDLEYFMNAYTVKGITCAQLITVRGIQNVTVVEGSAVTIGSSPARVHCKSTSTYSVTSVYAPPRKRVIYENCTTGYEITEVQAINQFTGAVQVGTNS